MSKKLKALAYFNDCIITYGFGHKKTTKAAKKYHKVSEKLAKKEGILK